MSDPSPGVAPPSTSTAVVKAGDRFTRPLLDAFRRGDAVGMLTQLGIDKLEGGALVAVRTLADLALETRRESISVLGNHEAFVRRTSHGELRQVIMPVRLSLAEKTLYQIPIRKPHDPDSLEPIANLGWWHKENERSGKRGRKPIWKDAEQTSAEVSYQGFLRLNGVAGCAVGQPPHVMVDGVARTNPYVQRTELSAGRLGDIVRVVIALTVVGPTPATGNPVVVNYTLDYDPAKDLQHMLAKVADDHPDECYLLDETELPTGEEKKPGWKFVPLYGGVGYYCNLRTDGVKEVYAEFVNLLQNAVKKAQTIARRNAMKSHPALAFHTVEVDKNGRAIIPIVGWAGDRSTMDKWTGLVSRLARGQTIDIEAEEVRDVSETYDPEQHRAGGGAGHVDAPGTVTEIDPDVAEKNRLIEQIDGAIPLLSPASVTSLGYDPAKQTVLQLREVLAKVNSILDAS